jgi:hypothetical protein
MTFEKNPIQENQLNVVFPNLLDQPNNPSKPEIILNFE